MSTPSEATSLPSSNRFDHDPSDTELACLLQGSSGPVGIMVVDSDGTLRIRPALVPVTGIMLSMVFGALVFTGAILFMQSRPGPRPPGFTVGLWGMLAFCWLLLIPFWGIVLLLVNRFIAAKDDFVRADAENRRLELCEAGRTFRADEILAFTEVSRFYLDAGRSGKWLPKLQTGVLVRTDDGQVELHALVDGNSRPPSAERLASIFGVSVRRIKLTKAESRELNDC